MTAANRLPNSMVMSGQTTRLRTSLQPRPMINPALSYRQITLLFDGCSAGCLPSCHQSHMQERSRSVYQSVWLCLRYRWEQWSRCLVPAYAGGAGGEATEEPLRRKPDENQQRTSTGCGGGGLLFLGTAGLLYGIPAARQ